MMEIRRIVSDIMTRNGTTMLAVRNAVIFDPTHFAAHGNIEDGLSLTHLPTGMRAAYAADLDQAERIAEALEAIQFDWESNDTNPERFKAISEQARAAIKKAKEQK